MSVSAAHLSDEREKALTAIQNRAEMYLERLAPETEKLSLRYLPSCAKQGYAATREKELEVRATLHGPHRDDFSVQLSKKEAKGFASEGQKRSIIAALKLAEWSEESLFGVDDFGVHLDQSRKSALLSEIEKLGQVFLTAPEMDEDSKCIQLA